MVKRIGKMKIAGHCVLKPVCECEGLDSVDIKQLNTVQ
jgi:hypothetical protein